MQEKKILSYKEKRAIRDAADEAMFPTARYLNAVKKEFAKMLCEETKAKLPEILAGIPEGASVVRAYTISVNTGKQDADGRMKVIDVMVPEDVQSTLLVDFEKRFQGYIITLDELKSEGYEDSLECLERIEETKAMYVQKRRDVTRLAMACATIEEAKREFGKVFGIPEEVIENAIL